MPPRVEVPDGVVVTGEPASVTIGLADDGAGLRSVSVWLADGDEPLPGFTRDDCQPLHRDGLREPVIWRDRRLADLEQDTIRLRVNLYGAARLHAISLVP